MNKVEQALLTDSHIDDAILATTLKSMMTHQVDFADLYFQSSQHESWMLEDGIVKEGSYNMERGVGVRAISGEKTGFAYSDDISPLALQQAAEQADLAGGDAGVIEAPMPGLVKVLLAKPGQEVKEGDRLAVLEAMKMEHSLLAARDGVVAEVLVEEGAQVTAGAALVRLEEAEA